VTGSQRHVTFDYLRVRLIKQQTYLLSRKMV
jgi:hypothetical protein